MRSSPVRYGLEKARAAYILGRLKLQRITAATVMTMLAAAGIQICMLPLMIGYFHRVWFISPLANVVEGLLMLALIAGGAVFLGAHALVPASGRFLAMPVEMLGEAVTGLGGPLLEWSWASRRTPDFGESSGLLYAAYFGCLLVLMIALDRWNPLHLRPRGLSRWAVGGRSHYAFGKPIANSEVRDGDTYGVLKLTLHPTSYTWEFIPEPGKTFTDSGNAPCVP